MTKNARERKIFGCVSEEKKMERRVLEDFRTRRAIFKRRRENNLNQVRMQRAELTKENGRFLGIRKTNKPMKEPSTLPRTATEGEEVLFLCTYIPHHVEEIMQGYGGQMLGYCFNLCRITPATANKDLFAKIVHIQVLMSSFL
jgi:hypothetical protein